MRSIHAAALAGLAVLAVSCGKPRATGEASAPMIVGGTRVSESDAITKSTVALLTPDGDAFCTGSLIGAKLVVTAGHCVTDYPYDRIYVAFGTKAQAGSLTAERLRYATTVTRHEGYDLAQMDAEEAITPPNDIALLKLNAAAPSGFKPVAMLTTRNALQVGETLTLAGFGLTAYYRDTTGILYKVDTKITKTPETTKEIHFGGRPGKSACMGDSGGPAFVKRSGKLVLVGVTSRGSSICDEEGIYTDVRYFYDWLVATAAR